VAALIIHQICSGLEPMQIYEKDRWVVGGRDSCLLALHMESFFNTYPRR
jgi:hypothetical protein